MTESVACAMHLEQVLDPTKGSASFCQQRPPVAPQRCPGCLSFLVRESGDRGGGAHSL